MSDLCRCCGKNDVLQGYEQGICPSCGELYCVSCMKTNAKDPLRKCINCKIPLMLSEKKVYKDLEKLRTKYRNLMKSRKLTKQETLVMVATLNCLSERFLSGAGAPLDHLLARKMCQEVIDLDNPTGYYNMYHLLVETDPEQAIKMLRKSAEMKFNKAMLILAMEIAAKNNQKHTKESEKLLKEAALTGLPEAEYQLALSYHLAILPGEDPENTEFNEKRAFFWYRRAADQDHPASLNNLGLFYKGGNGCIGDVDKALDYFNKSMALGCKEGGYGAGMVYEEIGDFKRASQYYSRAALMNCAPAMFRLGLLIVTEKVAGPVNLTGEKPTRNEYLLQGLNMIQDASDQGFVDAQEYLDSVAEQITAIKADQAKIKILPSPLQ